MKRNKIDISFNNYRKLGWLLSQTKLKLLYEKLFNAGKIDCSFDSFTVHFLGTQPAPKIKWSAGGGELVWLISEMMNGQALPYNRDYINLLSQHFCKSNEDTFNSQSLRVLKSRPPNILTENFIENLISDLLTPEA